MLQDRQTVSSELADLRVDIDRLSHRLAELSAIGGIDGTEGSSRLAFSDEDRADGIWLSDG